MTFSENILRDLFPQLNDRYFLRMTRGVVVVFTALVLGFALNSEATIYQMVEQAYSVTLAMAFAPLAFGLFWSRATHQGALFSIVGGGLVWGVLLAGSLGKVSLPEGWVEFLEVVPPQFIALLVGVLAIIVGSLLPQWCKAGPSARYIKA